MVIREFMLFVLVILILLITEASSYCEEIVLIYDKATYELKVKRGEEVVAKFLAGHGVQSPLPKKRRGDLTTPEGFYYITAIRPSQQYFYFIEISYPNWNDFSWAYYRREIGWSDLERREGKKLGYAIGIHGGGAFRWERGRANLNWTQGCIALNNEDLKKLLQWIRPGNKVYIVDTNKDLFDLLKKFAYPILVRPLDFWEGALYLKIDDKTFWYFRLKETKAGKRVLIWEEWKGGYQTRREESIGEGRFNPELERELKMSFVSKIYNLLKPMEEKDLEQWK